MTYAERVAREFFGEAGYVLRAQELIKRVLEDAAKAARGPHIKNCQCGATSCGPMRNSAGLVERLADHDGGDNG